MPKFEIASHGQAKIDEAKGKAAACEVGEAESESFLE